MQKQSRFFRYLPVLGIITTIFIGGCFHTQKPQKSISLEKQFANITEIPDIIYGDIINLKKLTREDAPAYHAMFSADVRKNLSFPKLINLAYTTRYVNSLVSLMEHGKSMSYAIMDKKENILIGGIQVREPNVSYLGQLGMWLNENYRGGGKISEAIKMITTAYFSVRKNAKTIEAHAEIFNNRSSHVLERAGFVETDMFDNPRRLVFELAREEVLKSEEE